MSRSPARDRVQLVSAATLIAGLVLLLCTWTSAGAADGTDQVTGAGSTASAVTVNWSDGILGKDNKTVVAPHAIQTTPTNNSTNSDFFNTNSALFKNIQVTVSQTQDIVHQAVAVSWKGAPTTYAGDQGDYFQLMQCWGDADSGPNPEDCEYGSDGLYTGTDNSLIGSRSGTFCLVGNDPTGCDPLEWAQAHVAPGSNLQNYTVPFNPVGTDREIYGTADTGSTQEYFDKYSTNEVPLARTGSDGTGLVYFETLTGVQSPGLGCGVVDPTTNQPRDCWLVLVPRGEVKANGGHIANQLGSLNFLDDSPLGASNWSMRIQIHLGFAPLQQTCPIGSAKERQTVGTELAGDAVRSWQLKLNVDAQCNVLYGYTHTPEATQTSQLEAGAANGAAGLAFTNIPIGSEAGRGTGQEVPSPVPVVYAPVAVSATTLSFNISTPAGTKSTPVKLTPRLLAKALTQSYLVDLPEYLVNNPLIGPAPAWAVHNPIQMTNDPEFRALNPDLPANAGQGTPSSIMLNEDHSLPNQELWQWVLADPTAVAWLNGTPDPSGMVVNPAYTALGVAAQPFDSFPRADPTCFNTGQGSAQRPSTRCSLDLLPYLADDEDVATHVRGGNSPLGADWDVTKQGPDGQTGWWATGALLPAGHAYLWGVSDTASNATYGLVAAALCDASGQNCVSPDSSSVTAALNSATKDSAGLLHVNPATTPAGAYPLVNVTYAAVRSDDDPAAVADYANLIAYAAGAGQTPGEAPGDLPRGYLPLPPGLQAQAASAVAALRGGSATSAPASSVAVSTVQSSSDSGLSGLGLSDDSGTGGGGAGAPVATAEPAPGGLGAPSASSSSPGPAAIVKPTSTPAAIITPAQSSSAARYAPVLVIITGLAGLVGSRLIGIGRHRAGSLRQ